MVSCIFIFFIHSHYVLFSHTEALHVKKAFGAAVGSGKDLESLMKACPELTDVKYEVEYLPVGPWEKGPRVFYAFEIFTEIFFLATRCDTGGD